MPDVGTCSMDVCSVGLMYSVGIYSTGTHGVYVSGVVAQKMIFLHWKVVMLYILNN